MPTSAASPASEASEQQVTIDGEGTGPIEAFVNGLEETLNEPVSIVEYHEHAPGPPAAMPRPSAC